jgi:hypothetical protein
VNFHGKNGGDGCEGPMLEDWAWGHIAHSELYLKLLSVGWMVLGGVLAALFQRGQFLLGRAAYFALSAMVVLGIAVFQAIWLWGGLAMQGGWLFWLVVLDASLSFAAGYGLVVLGQARSRDAFGHARAGIASLVPIANLWLLFMPGQEPWKATFVGTALRGGLGFLAGVGLLVLSRLVEAHIYPEIEAGVIAVGDDPALAERFARLEVRKNSVSSVLREIVKTTDVPQEVAGGPTLLNVEAVGAVLRFTYVFSSPGSTLPAGLGDEIRAVLCKNAAFSELLSNGARIEYRYDGFDLLGKPVVLADFAVTAVDCDF